MLVPDWSPLADPGELASAPGVVDVVLIELDAAPADIAADNDAAERARADRFVRREHALRYGAARGWLRRLLGARLEVAPAAVAFTYGAYGKPALAAPAAPGLAFNLSHSGDLALVALAKAPDLGIDVEAIRPLDDLADLARNNFAPAETASLLARPAGRRLDAFFTCWTCKEAVVKLWGDGLSADLAAFEVSTDPDAEAALLALDRPGMAVDDIALWGFSPAPGFRAALAAPAAAGLRPRFWRVDA